MAANARLLRDGEEEVKGLDMWYRDRQLRQEKGQRFADRFVPGFWDALWSKDSDWFNLKQEPGRKKVSRGWEEHTDSIRYEPHNYTVQAPPWHNTTVSGVYKGRKSWQTELDWENPIVNRGREPFVTGVLREYDPLWWDPPVAKGTSFDGPEGKDTMYTPTVHSKIDRPLPISEWSKTITEGSRQMRQIRALYDISPQHPGLNINAGNERDGYLGALPHEVGTQTRDMLNSDSNTIPNLLRVWPRFWDSPLGEAAHEKFLFGAKVGAAAGVARSALAIALEPKRFWPQQPYNWPGHALFWTKPWAGALRAYLPTFTLFPASYCGLLSVASMARGGRDDQMNALLPSAVCGAMFGIAKNHVYRGFAFAGLSYAASVVFNIGRQQQFSFYGPDMPVRWSIGPSLLTGVNTVVEEADVPFMPSLNPPIKADYSN